MKSPFARFNMPPTLLKGILVIALGASLAVGVVGAFTAMTGDDAETTMSPGTNGSIDESGAGGGMVRIRGPGRDPARGPGPGMAGPARGPGPEMAGPAPALGVAGPGPGVAGPAPEAAPPVRPQPV